MRSTRIKHKEPNDLTPSSFFEKERSSNFFEKSNKPFFSPAVQTKLKVNQPGDVYEQEADKMSGKVTDRLSGPNQASGKPNQHNNSSTQNNISIQRKCAECEKEEVQTKKDHTIQRESDEMMSVGSNFSESTPEAPLAETAPDAMTPETTAVTSNTGSLIVEDNAVPAAGQMTKSGFLGSLRSQVYATASDALSGTPFSSGISSYIESAFGRYYGYSATQLEQTIKQQEPSSSQAQSAGQMIHQINARVLSEIRMRVPDVGGLAQTVGDAASGIGDTISGIGSSIGSLLFKENSGGAHATQSPSAVMNTLGKGSRLDSHTQKNMESVFGTSLSNVEIHNDSKASQLSGNMNARAFTVGNHIGFANGEHKPGTLIGDALMAHELAHVIQQQGSKDEMQSLGAIGYSEFEEDADTSAVNAILSMKGIKGGIKGIGKQLLPKLKTGLKLQRCPQGTTPRVRVRYRRYGGTGFSDSCPAYCACVNDELGRPVSGGQDRYTPRKSTVQTDDGQCPPGLVIEWEGSTIKSEAGLAVDPCPTGPTRSCQ